MKYNYLVTASFINDKCRKVNTASPENYHFKVDKYDLMHNNDFGALYLKTPKIGLLVSYVSFDSLKRHIENGTLNEEFINRYLKDGYGKNWPARAETARQYLINLTTGV